MAQFLQLTANPYLKKLHFSPQGSNVIGSRLTPAKLRFQSLHERQFRSEVVSGLLGTPKRLPCKYFYDQRGSHLFDAICNLDEYYLTRTELAIMRCHAPAMAEAIGAGAMLIEYGSGNSAKTRLLLDQLRSPIAYVPIDISEKQLRISAPISQAIFGA